MLKVRQVKVPILKDNKEYLEKALLTKLKIKKEDLINFTILKKAIDARDKNNINYVYELKVKLNKEDIILKRNSLDIVKEEEQKEEVLPLGDTLLSHRPVVIGSGPAGLFCALLLAEYNFKPIVIERGKRVEERVKDVNLFWEKNILNPNDNVQFGEGGAGTFSDGKLNTLIKDKDGLKENVLKTFVKYGAKEEILYLNKPHIGTDNLQKIVKNIREDIISKGGTFYFEETLEDISLHNNKIIKIKTNKKEIETDVLVLAIGHSARDTFFMLNKYLKMASKPFAVGIRISHKQEWINESQYGKMAECLPPADYKLTYTTKKGRGVYSFCMCPGGFVVNSSSEEKALCINGMSNSARNEENANSAIVVTVDSKDYGEDVFGGINYQKALEKLAYEKGKGNIPTQRWEDFKKNKVTTSLKEVKPLYKGNISFSNLHEILPKEICESLEEAIEYFGTKIKNFNHPDALISAVESRTSSPIRIIRNENFVSNIQGIYPCGEGAGYAGGITSSAIDGLKVAREIIKHYHM